MLGIAALGQLPQGGFPFKRPAVGPVVFERLYHTAEDLERRLEEQRGNTFGVKWYESFIEATEAAAAKAEEAKSAAQRIALEKAVEAAEEIVTERPQFAEEALFALQAAVNATRATAIIKHANRVAELARMYAYYQDEEDIEMLLLH